MPRTSRRALLRASAAGVLGVLTGCTAGRGDDPPETVPSVTDSPTPPGVATPPPGECDPATPPEPDTGKGLPAAQPYPDRPAELGLEPVHTFLRAYEAAYVHNRTLAEVADDGDCLERLAVDVTGVSVRASGEGYLGTVDTFGSFSGTSCPDVSGTDTPTPLPHSDFPGSARYYVTERFLVRAGVALECW